MSRENTRYVSYVSVAYASDQGGRKKIKDEA